MKKFILSIIIVCFFNLSFADYWWYNNLGGSFYLSNRSPTATEDGVQELFTSNGLNITNFIGQFYWFDTVHYTFWDYAAGQNGSYVWVQRGVTSDNSIIHNGVSHSLNSAFQVSATTKSFVNYSVTAQLNALLLGSASGSVYLEVADDSGFTTNVELVAQANPSISGVNINSNQSEPIALSGNIGAGKYVRIRTAVNSGSVSFSYITGQETY